MESFFKESTLAENRSDQSLTRRMENNDFLDSLHDDLLVAILQTEGVNDDGSAIELSFAGMNGRSALDECPDEIVARHPERLAIDGDTGC